MSGGESYVIMLGGKPHRVRTAEAYRPEKGASPSQDVLSKLRRKEHLCEHLPGMFSTKTRTEKRRNEEDKQR